MKIRCIYFIEEFIRLSKFLQMLAFYFYRVIGYSDWLLHLFSQIV